MGRGTTGILPCNIDAEKKVLGAMISDADGILRVQDILSPEDFYQPSHQIVYQTLLEIHRSGRLVDFLILSDALERKNLVTEAGGPLYPAELVQGMTTTVRAAYHAEIVLEKAIRRRFILDSQRDAAEGATEEIDILAGRLLERSRKMGSTKPGGPQSLKQLLEGVMADTHQRIEDAQEGRPIQRYLDTGFTDLDHLTGGIDKGEMVILASQPSLGKTALACSLALNIAQTGPVLFFSLETDADEILRRMLSIVAAFSFHDLTIGQVPKNAWNHLTTASDHLRSLPLYIDDGRGISPDQVLALAEKIKHQTGNLKLIVIDYLQLMTIPYLRAFKKYEQVTEISHQCQILPGRIGCPLLLLSQLSRESAKESRAPRMSDLRDSGAIEQDAHQIWFISLPKGQDKSKPGRRNLHVEKNKKGPTGLVSLQFTPAHFAFHNYSGTDAPDAFDRYADDREVPF